LIWKIIDLRAYTAAKHSYEEGQKERDISKRPKGAGIDRVRDIAWELNKRKFEESKDA